jgi:hypothetical protein
VLALALFVIFATPSPPSPKANERFTAATVEYVDVELRWSRGQLTILSVKHGRFDKPTALARFRGRFEARALAKGATREHVAFDFPLLANAETDDATTESRAIGGRLRGGVTATTTVRLPLPDGADAIAVYDSASKRTVTAPLAAGDPPPR